jgi:hypothetical protein
VRRHYQDPVLNATGGYNRLVLRKLYIIKKPKNTEILILMQVVHIVTTRIKYLKGNEWHVYAKQNRLNTENLLARWFAELILLP